MAGTKFHENRLIIDGAIDPRKHETLAQRWINYGPPSATLARQ